MSCLNYTKYGLQTSGETTDVRGRNLELMSGSSLLLFSLLLTLCNLSCNGESSFRFASIPLPIATHSPIDPTLYLTGKESFFPTKG